MNLKEKVKLDNQHAHVAVLIRKLNETNSSLEHSILNRDSILEEVSKMTKNLKESQNELERISQESLDKIAIVKNKLSLLTSKEKELKELEDKTRLDLSKKTSIASEEVGVFQREKAKIQEEKTRLLEEVVVANTNLESLTKRVSSVSKDMEKTMDRKREEERYAHESEEKHQVQIGKLKKEESSLESTLKKLEEEVLYKKENIDLGQINLAEREVIIKRRERDFQILLVRLRNLYQEIKPGTPVNI